MILTSQKTKKIGYNLWYQLWKHPECEFKNDLLNCGDEAKIAYEDAQYYPEACVFCAWDAQERIDNRRDGKDHPFCSFCPLRGQSGDCCHGYYRKWALSTEEKERKLYAKAIVDMIAQWKPT